MSLSNQFAEHMALRKQLGGLIGENRRLYPPPPEMKAQAASHGKPGAMAARETMEDKNQYLRDKIASTEVSNEIGRGERKPTEERFG